MKITQFDPGTVLGNGIIKMSRQELCELVSKLCRRVVAEVGTRGRRGGIYPDNISINAQGEIGIGPSGKGPWEGEELKFIAPELYWNGQCSAASDVYSVGMMLYYAVSGGRLPLEDECRDAQLRRMGGDNFAAPRSAGRRLGEIIEKAIRFKAAERYQTLEELRVELDSCVKNLYLSGVPSAEAIFKKNDDDLSAVERMMVGIIEKEEGTDAPEEDEVSAAESVKVYAPAKTPADGGKGERGEMADEMIRKIKSAERPAAPKLSEENNPFFLDPVAPARRSPNQNTQYTRNAEREKKIAEEVKKRRRRPLAVILVLCAVLVVVAIIFNAMLKDFQQAKQIPDNTIAGMDSDPYAGTTPPQGDSASPNGSSGLEPIGGEETAAPEESGAPASTASPAPSAPVAHSYELILEDVSWTGARDKCIAKGGHLVVINDKAEFDTIVALAEEKDVDKVWIGCHRVDGELVWETDETGYLSWAKGEPSFVDVNDDVAEDYIMLWNNKGWAYNDNRNDPIADYPQWYSGTVAYICEYGG